MRITWIKIANWVHNKNSFIFTHWRPCASKPLGSGRMSKFSEHNFNEKILFLGQLNDNHGVVSRRVIFGIEKNNASVNKTLRSNKRVFKVHSNQSVLITAIITCMTVWHSVDLFTLECGLQILCLKSDRKKVGQIPTTIISFFCFMCINFTFLLHHLGKIWNGKFFNTLTFIK